MATNTEAGEQVKQELANWMKQTGEFVREQAPKTAEDLLRAGTISNSMGLVICIVVIIIGVFLLRFGGKHKQKTGDSPFSDRMGSFPHGIALIAGWVSIGICSMVTIFCIYALLIIQYAPRAYLLKELIGK